MLTKFSFLENNGSRSYLEIEGNSLFENAVEFCMRRREYFQRAHPKSRQPGFIIFQYLDGQVWKNGVGQFVGGKYLRMALDRKAEETQGSHQPPTNPES